MSMYAVKDTELTAIATAIRSKGGASGTITIAEMPSAINNISGGGAEVTNVTFTGTHTIQSFGDFIYAQTGYDDFVAAPLATPPSSGYWCYSVCGTKVDVTYYACCRRTSAGAIGYTGTTTSSINMPSGTVFKVTKC